VLACRVCSTAAKRMQEVLSTEVIVQMICRCGPRSGRSWRDQKLKVHLRRGIPNVGRRGGPSLALSARRSVEFMASVLGADRRENHVDEESI
jgi:hypothetical protein